VSHLNVRLRSELEPASDSWLDQRHAEWTQNIAKWRYVLDHYTADVLDTTKIGTYLIRRAQGESDEAYEERQRLADYTPHFSALVDSLAGMIFNVEGAAKRTWTKAFGSPDDDQSLIGRLWQNADLRGNGYLTVFKMLATALIHSRTMWILVEGGASGHARIRLIHPRLVDNWIEEDGRLIEVKMIDPIDGRKSLREKVETSESWVVFDLQKWTRWTKVESDTKGQFTEVPGATGTHKFIDPSGMAALPIFRVQLPITRMVGYILARKANAIFNKESHRDHLLTVAHFPKLVVTGDDDFFQAVVKSLIEGANVLQQHPDFPQPHQYIFPSAEPAKILSEVLVQKRDELWRTGFREYGDSARERTATEVRQDVASGVAAFLQLLKAALDDAENQTLWRLTQVEFTDPSKWYGARVARSEDFLPLDIDLLLQNLRVRYFGETSPVPVGRNALIQVAGRIAEMDGLDADPSQLAAAVDAQALTNALGLLATLTVPAEIKARMTVRNLMALGYVEPEEKISIVDDEGAVVEILLSEHLEKKAFDIAQSQEQAALDRESFFQPTTDG